MVFLVICCYKSMLLFSTNKFKISGASLIGCNRKCFKIVEFKVFIRLYLQICFMFYVLSILD